MPFRFDVRKKPASRPAPSGYGLRCYREGDDADWWQILERAFDDTDRATLEKVIPRQKACAGWKPEHTLFVVHEGAPVAVCSLDGPRDGKFWIHWVGVLPEHQRRGLATALCARLLRQAHEDGIAVVDALAANLKGMGPIYRRLGGDETPPENEEGEDE